MMRRAIFGMVAAMAAGAMASPGRAATIVYTGVRQIDSINADYSITTDGTIGSVTAANVTDFRITLRGPNGVNTLTTANAGVRGSFSATATTLSVTGTTDRLFINTAFKTSGPGYYPHIVFYSDQTNASAYANAIHTTGEWVGSSAAGFAFVGGAAIPAVPEPATWAMMLLGFGGIGAVLRHRRPASASVAQA